MSTPEFPARSFEAVASETVRSLRDAALWLQKPEVFWTSLDEEHRYMYMGYPLHQDKEPIDVSKLHTVSMAYLFERNPFPSWLLIQGEPINDGDAIRLSQYYLEDGRPIHQLVEDIDISEDNEERDSLKEALEAARQRAENLDPQTLPLAEEEAKGRITLATAFLIIHTRDVFSPEFHERRDSMTREERLMERAEEYAWLKEPEVDKVQPVRWWVIGDCMAPLVYAVRAKSPDLAAAILDEHYKEMSGFGLSWFDVDKLEEEYLGRFDSQFAHPEIEVVRLIPFSRVPYPEDPNNMTAEQKEAFDKLRG